MNSRDAEGWRGLVAHPPAWLGRRGAVLMLLGFLWISQGFDLTGEAPYDPSLVIFHRMMPDWLRVTLWTVTGLLGIAGATIDRPRWERWGFAALMFMGAERMLSYGVSWLVWLGSNTFGQGELGYGYAWLPWLRWLVICLVLYTVAGWHESDRDVRVDIAEAHAEARRDHP